MPWLPALKVSSWCCASVGSGAVGSSVLGFVPDMCVLPVPVAKDGSSGRLLEPAVFLGFCLAPPYLVPCIPMFSNVPVFEEAGLHVLWGSCLEVRARHIMWERVVLGVFISDKG